MAGAGLTTTGQGFEYLIGISAGGVGTLTGGNTGISLCLGTLTSANDWLWKTQELEEMFLVA